MRTTYFTNRTTPLYRLCLLVFLAIAACADDGGPTFNLSDTVHDGAQETPDVSSLGTVDTVGSSDIGELSADGTEFDSGGEQAGEFGASCDSDDDCLSQKCVESHVGSVCSSLCIESCPPGWECAQDPTAVGAISYVCFPRFQKLCFPCESNSDCVGGSNTGGHKCVSFGTDGSFCGGDCSESDCPLGFSCAQVPDSFGIMSDQCVPKTGECPCTDPAKKLTASTLCYKENQWGTCGGSRYCSDRGLTECDAALPMREVCDGLDNNCDGVVDEGFRSQTCEKTTEFGVCVGATSCTVTGVVCNAPDPSVEVCDDVDNDCDGEADEGGALGCVTVYADGDGDGVGAGPSMCVCTPPETGVAFSTGDCDDEDANQYPGAVEVCDDVDNNCSGSIDEAGASGCTLYFADADGDGYGVTGSELCLCVPTALYSATDGNDCNDAATTIHPGVEEVCNGKDDNCDGLVDPTAALGCVDYFRDDDGDGFGQKGDFMCGCGPKFPYTSTKISDCDDASPAIFPGQVELCNGKDDDCDGQVDGDTAVGCTNWYKDQDGDGQGDSGDVSCQCAVDGVYTALVGGDCNDADVNVFSGQVENCNGVDDNCDGETDELGAVGCSIYFRDQDGDGFGVVTDAVCACVPISPYTAVEAGDCDDSTVDISPDALESCNGLDDDCDSAIDEVSALGCTEFLLDGDGDGVGTDGPGLCLCQKTGDYTATIGGDCQDDDAQVFPGQAEICNNKDDNCDGDIDGSGSLGCKFWFVDGDSDGFGGGLPPACLCTKTDGLSIKGGDCDDGAALVNPFSPEVCNGVDDNCDTVVDEGCGMPVLGWPTYGFDPRRTGHNMQDQGPQTANLKWSATLADPITTSAVVSAELKRVMVTAKNTVIAYTLDGKEVWKTTLNQLISGNGGPTLRLGGSLMVVAGNELVMLGPNGNLIWSSPLAAPTGASPLVDGVGATIVVTPAGVQKIDPAGQLVWTNSGAANWSETAHPAVAPNGLIIVATTDGAIRGLNPDSGVVSWSLFGGQPIGNLFVVVGESGLIYAARSGAVVSCSMAGISAATGSFAGKPTGLGIFNTGFECCNPLDYILVARDQTNGIVRYASSLGTAAWSKGPLASGPHAIDFDGDIYVGTAAKQLAALNSAGNSKWNFTTTGTVTAQPTIALGYVYFGDSSGKFYALGP